MCNCKKKKNKIKWKIENSHDYNQIFRNESNFSII